jgi:hypothetical protein
MAPFHNRRLAHRIPIAEQSGFIDSLFHGCGIEPENAWPFFGIVVLSVLIYVLQAF